MLHECPDVLRHWLVLYAPGQNAIVNSPSSSRQKQYLGLLQLAGCIPGLSIYGPDTIAWPFCRGIWGLPCTYRLGLQRMGAFEAWTNVVESASSSCLSLTSDNRVRKVGYLPDSLFMIYSLVQLLLNFSPRSFPTMTSESCGLEASRHL